MPMQFVRQLLRSPYFRLAFWVIAIGLMLYLALRDVSLADVWQALRQADLRFVWLALLSVMINIWSKTARWQVLISSPGKGIGFGKISMGLLAGQTLNWFLPGRVGELYRLYVIGGMGPGRTYTLGTIAIEKVLDMLAYALLFLLLLLILPLPGWINNSGVTFSIITGVVTLGFVLLAVNPRWVAQIFEKSTGWIPERFRSLLVDRVQSGLASLMVVRRRSDLLKLAALTLLTWISAVCTNSLVAQSLGLRIPWTAAGIVLIVLQAGISVPTVPGRIGLFQYLCILSLALFGIGQVSGLSFGILLQAIIFIPPTLFGLFSLWYLSRGNPQGILSGSGEKIQG